MRFSVGILVFCKTVFLIAHMEFSVTIELFNHFNKIGPTGGLLAE